MKPADKPKSLADLPTEMIEQIVLDVCPIYRLDALEMPGVRPEGRDRDGKRSSDDFWLKERVNDLKRLLRTSKALYEAANPILYRCPFILSGPTLKAYVAPPEKNVARKLTQLLRTLEEAPMLADLAVAFVCEEPAWVSLDDHLRRSAARAGMPLPAADAKARSWVSLAKLVLASLPRAQSLTMVRGFCPLDNPAAGAADLESLTSLVISTAWPISPSSRIGVAAPNLQTLCLRGRRVLVGPDFEDFMGGPPLKHLTRLVVDAERITPTKMLSILPHVARLERFAYKKDEMHRRPDEIHQPASSLLRAIDRELLGALARRCAGSLRTLCLDVGRPRAVPAAPSFGPFCKLEDVWLKSDIVVDSGRGPPESPELGIWSLPPSLRRLHVKTSVLCRGGKWGKGQRMTPNVRQSTVPETGGPGSVGPSSRGDYTLILNEWLTTKVAKGAYPVLEDLALSNYTCPQKIADEVSGLGIKLLGNADPASILW
ncbi:hypothetical protein CSOJ01_14588 [Colletotrichum sojae]|uniref:F-box domain-containing protein n=1 Tax=Colletotrichum sojae TaxID=2175907 RepID=A0A8H6IQ93_9PEZI|nr:hypothetical protein CSOJ01_14588 [Colletotrichum sojae]